MMKRFFPFELSGDSSAPAGAGPRLAAVTDAGIDQQLADSFNANNAVMAYVLALTNSKLPALTPQPDWYEAFVAKFSDAKTHALEWQNTVTPGLVAIPSGIVNYAQIWSLNNTTISQSIAFLQQDPNNEQARAALSQALGNLVTGVGGELTTAKNFTQVVDDFATQLTADAATMQQAITDAVQTEGYDAEKVKQLQNDVDELKSEIAKWQVVVTAAGIGAGVAVFAGACIAIFSFGAGLAFGIIGAAAGIATLIAAEVKIKELSAKVAQDQADMTGLNQQIATLKLLGSNLDSLIKLSGEASQQANTDWQTLQQFCSVIAGIDYNQATPATVALPTAPATAA